MEEQKKYMTLKAQMDEYICCSGSFQHVIDDVVNSGLLPKELAVESLNYLMENIDLLEKGKEMLAAKQADDYLCGSSGFIPEGANFYIQLKKSTILLAAMLVSSAAMSFFDANIVALISPIIVKSVFGGVQQLWFRVYEESGEKCIIRELASKRSSVVSPKDIKKKIGNTCTKEYNCNFRKKGKCKCKSADIEDICETLKEKGAVFKSGNCYGYIV